VATCTACGEHNGADARFCSACGARLPGKAAAEVRKTVSVLFCDVTGSTELGERLDAETMHQVLSRHFDVARGIVEAHGGTLEKYIGDALMAVFGVPTLHEDDALRAVRAAADMRNALPGLNTGLAATWGVELQTRTGIATGEVIAADPSDGRLVSGDMVNAAARLEQAADPGEILVDEGTYELVSGAVSVGDAHTVQARGKRQGLLVRSLLGVDDAAEAVPRSFDVGIVGRKRELAQLRDAYDRAVADRACQLFTLLGAAGIGKSRLGAEFIHGLPAGSVTLVGRCLPYGEGITFWPVAEIVRSLVEQEGELREILAATPDGELVERLIAGTIGERKSSAQREETFWAVRRLFEAAGARRPLVVVVEDIHWAEPTLLDLIEHLADWVRDTPIMLLCLARPELLDSRGTWGGGKLNATAALLEPLGEDEGQALIDLHLAALPVADVDAGTRRRMLEVAGGNPLFLEQLVAAASETGRLPDRIPASVNALIAARLDQLAPEERRALELAAVIGKVFSGLAVRDLAAPAGNGDLEAALGQLVRKDLIRPSRLDMPGSDGYRFRHILIRDVAYQRISKQARAELHERFADWIEARGETGAEHADIAGYHLEQALVMRRELGRSDSERPDLALRAGERLAVAGARARATWDLPAARSLLERAAGVLTEFPEQRLSAMLDLADTTRMAGDEQRAAAILEGVLLAAGEQNDPRLEARAALARATQFGESSGGWDEVERVALGAIEVFERESDEQGLAAAWSRIAWVHQSRAHYARAMDALEVALRHARSAELVTEELPIVANLCVTLWMGPLPAGRAIERCTTLREQIGERHPLVGAFVAAPVGVLQALAGTPNEGRATLAAARATIADMHSGEPVAALLRFSGQVELLDGQPAAAEPFLLESAEHYRSIGHLGGECDVAAALSLAMRMQGRGGDAASWANRSRETAVPDDRNNQIAWRLAVASANGDASAAGEAVEIARACESPELLADALLTRAATTESLDDADEAAALYMAKGHTVGLALAQKAAGALAGRSA